MLRRLVKSDIPGLNSISPEDWGMDYEAFLDEFLSEQYFDAFVITENNQIVATANSFIKDEVGWIANVIVDATCRGKGFGTQVTKHIIDFIFDKGCKTQLLLASDLGEPVYLKLGFQIVSNYVCFKSEKSSDYQPNNLVRKLKQEDLESVYRLDFEINGENRFHLIDKYYSSGFGYFNSSHELLGIYLPGFGRGLVLAKEEAIGIELLKLKHSEKGKTSFLPEENTVGLEFLHRYTVRQGTSLKRMILGKAVSWNPQMIYSYASGYCG